MCLNNITKVCYEKDRQRTRRAYKLMRLSDHYGVTPFTGHSIPVGEWVTAVERKLREERWDDRWAQHRKYTSGFHVFPTLMDAKLAEMEYTPDGAEIVPVLVRKVMYEGFDGTSESPSCYKRIKNLVAKQIYVIPKDELEEK